MRQVYVVILMRIALPGFKYLQAQSLLSRTVWEGLGGVALLEGMCHWVCIVVSNVGSQLLLQYDPCQSPALLPAMIMDSLEL